MPTLIIGGMHRSGTSLTAGWLRKCGLFIGTDLFQSRYTHSNPEGQHFEDRDFLEFHAALLKANDLPRHGLVVDDAISIPAEYWRHAESLIAQRNQYPQWGWKEPRTSLFMDLWLNRLPNAYLMIVYRPYARVVDSLLRRDLDQPRLVSRWFHRLRMHNRDAHIAHYIRVWSHYNRALLAAAENAPTRTLVFHIRDVVPQSHAAIAYMNTKWGFNLDCQSAGDTFDKKRLKRETTYVNLQAPQVVEAVQEADQIYLELETWRQQTLADLT